MGGGSGPAAPRSGRCAVALLLLLLLPLGPSEVGLDTFLCSEARVFRRWVWLGMADQFNQAAWSQELTGGRGGRRGTPPSGFIFTRSTQWTYQIAEFAAKFWRRRYLPSFTLSVAERVAHSPPTSLRRPAFGHRWRLNETKVHVRLQSVRSRKVTGTSRCRSMPLPAAALLNRDRDHIIYHVRMCNRGYIRKSWRHVRVDAPPPTTLVHVFASTANSTIFQIFNVAASPPAARTLGT